MEHREIRVGSEGLNDDTSDAQLIHRSKHQSAGVMVGDGTKDDGGGQRRVIGSIA